MCCKTSAFEEHSTRRIHTLGGSAQSNFSRLKNITYSLTSRYPRWKLGRHHKPFFVKVTQDFSPADSEFLDLLMHQPIDPEYVIQPYQVEISLAKLNIYKSPVPDGLPTWLLKECGPFLSEPIAAVFNSSLRQEYFPKIWKWAEVVPVPKINPPCARAVETDLRPISLLPVLAKVFEGFVRRWLMNSLLPMFDDFSVWMFEWAFHSTCADINNAYMAVSTRQRLLRQSITY